MSTKKVMERLKQLYQLAVLRPEEENDEARKNEARTSAFLLLKHARENRVKLKFIPCDENGNEIRATPPTPVHVNLHGSEDIFVDWIQQAIDAKRRTERTRQQGGFRAPPVPSRPSQARDYVNAIPPGVNLVNVTSPSLCAECHCVVARNARAFYRYKRGITHVACGWAALFDPDELLKNG